MSTAPNEAHISSLPNDGINLGTIAMKIICHFELQPADHIDIVHYLDADDTIVITLVAGTPAFIIMRTDAVCQYYQALKGDDPTLPPLQHQPVAAV